MYYIVVKISMDFQETISIQLCSDNNSRMKCIVQEKKKKKKKAELYRIWFFVFFYAIRRKRADESIWFPFK